MFNVDWSVRLGDLIVLLGFLGTIAMYGFRAGRFAAALDIMRSEITSLKDVAKTVADVLTTVAVQKVELSNIREDIQELKHGKGFIAPQA